MPRNAIYSVLGPNYDNASITSNIPEQEQAFGSGKSASQSVKLEVSNILASPVQFCSPSFCPLMIRTLTYLKFGRLTTASPWPTKHKLNWVYSGRNFELFIFLVTSKSFFQESTSWSTARCGGSATSSSWVPRPASWWRPTSPWPPTPSLTCQGSSVAKGILRSGSR